MDMPALTPDLADRLRNWKDAQRDWPQNLYCGDRVATVEDCNAWLVDIGQLRQAAPHLQKTLDQAQWETFEAALETFRSRVIIHRGDLLSDSFKCSLGECG
jgi:hypothetical protein